MATGRACVLVEPNRLETWDVPIFDPPQGGALVQVVIGGVCGSDLHITTGDAGVMPFPIILGHEGIGRIERLGDGTTTDYAGVPVATGDLVYWAPFGLCHRCYSCTVLDETPCENTTFFEHAEKPNWATYADFACLPNGLPFFKLPDGADPSALAALGCALPTVLRGFDRCGLVRVGETVVVQGAGPVGLAATVVAAASGASQVIVVDGVSERLENARQLGATATLLLEGEAEERKQQIYALCGPAGPNVVVEAAGYLPAFPEGYALTGIHGRYIILGLWGAIGDREISPRDLSTKNMSVAGASFPKPKHYYGAVQLAARLQDRYPLAALITDRFAIADAAKALEAVKHGRTIKAIIDPSL